MGAGSGVRVGGIAAREAFCMRATRWNHSTQSFPPGAEGSEGYQQREGRGGAAATAPTSAKRTSPCRLSLPHPSTVIFPPVMVAPARK